MDKKKKGKLITEEERGFLNAAHRRVGHLGASSEDADSFFESFSQVLIGDASKLSRDPDTKDFVVNQEGGVTKVFPGVGIKGKNKLP